MLLEKLRAPISLLNVSQYGVDIRRLQNSLLEEQTEYEWDRYLLQKDKIFIIQSDISANDLSLAPSNTWPSLYEGTILDCELSELFPTLSESTLAQVLALKPTRRRCISEYVLTWRNGWHIERVPSQSYCQQQALMASAEVIDYRHFPRRFKELPEHLFDEDLRSIILGVADKVRELLSSVQKLTIVVHHTIVYAIANQLSTNSPEGIHQDGLDFIVSAIVVERRNIVGGSSHIYAKDKSTKLLQAELQPGQGIFQPDLGTDLWHEVTPVERFLHNEIGYRSTIGVDITVGNFRGGN